MFQFKYRYLLLLFGKCISSVYVDCWRGYICIHFVPHPLLSSPWFASPGHVSYRTNSHLRLEAAIIFLTVSPNSLSFHLYDGNWKQGLRISHVICNFSRAARNFDFSCNLFAWTSFSSLDSTRKMYRFLHSLLFKFYGSNSIKSEKFLLILNLSFYFTFYIVSQYFTSANVVVRLL